MSYEKKIRMGLNRDEHLFLFDKDLAKISFQKDSLLDLIKCLSNELESYERKNDAHTR